MNYLKELFNLENKVAVVTGGTGELCGKMAEGLALAGVKTVVAGRSEEKSKRRIDFIERYGGEAVFCPVEISSRKSLENLKNFSLEKFDRIDILINGAGMNAATPFADISDEEWDRIFEVNLKSIFMACQVFGQYFLDENVAASVINLGSMSGIIPLSRVFTYSATKAAVHNLSRNLAREWGSSKIRVNTIVPGFFPAEQNRKILDQSRIDSILNHTPMNRFGEAQELVGATLLLASQAGSFINGAEIVVDGGFSAQTI